MDKQKGVPLIQGKPKTQEKPRAKNSIQVFLMGGSGSSTWAITYYFPRRCTSRKQSQPGFWPGHSSMGCLCSNKTLATTPEAYPVSILVSFIYHRQEDSKPYYIWKFGDILFLSKYMIKFWKYLVTRWMWIHAPKKYFEKFLENGMK